MLVSSSFFTYQDFDSIKTPFPKNTYIDIRKCVRLYILHDFISEIDVHGKIKVRKKWGVMNPIITYLSQQKASCRSNIYVSGVGDIIYLKINFKRKCLGRSFILNFWWYINPDLKVSLYYVRIHLKIIPWKFRTLNPNKFSSYLPAKFAFFLKN